MTDVADLPASIAQIWTDRYRTGVWHRIWIEHLKLQGATPDTIDAYQRVMQLHQNPVTRPDDYDDLVEQREQATRHEVVAHLDAFNNLSGQIEAHHGLASSDIVDVANQIRITDSLALITDRALRVADRLRRHMCTYAAVKLLARTHGQPAQLTTLGHRHATILAPLLDWVERAADTVAGYPMRPPSGAVGTAADLARVLNHRQAPTRGLGATSGASEAAGVSEAAPSVEVAPSPDGKSGGGWGPVDQYAASLAGRLGFLPVMDATRQVYHRSHDLRVAGLLAELASLGQTWANDRRLESLLGLGGESLLTEQVASSSMASKRNPRFSERIVALSVVTRSHLAAMAELAGMEWLEGDVSTSAARRLVLPAMFQNIEDLLSNWAYVADIWQPDPGQIRLEVLNHRYQWATAAIMDLLIEHGVSRPDAHRTLREAWSFDRPEVFADPLMRQFEKHLAVVLVDRGIEIGGGPSPTNPARPETTRERLRRVTEELLAEPIGNVPDQIDWLDRRTTRLMEMVAKDEWTPQVRP